MRDCDARRLSDWCAGGEANYRFSMTERNHPQKPSSPEFPRRVRVSAMEIGLALALTFAAVIQLISSLSGREGKSFASSDTGGYIRPAR